MNRDQDLPTASFHSRKLRPTEESTLTCKLQVVPCWVLRREGTGNKTDSSRRIRLSELRDKPVQTALRAHTESGSQRLCGNGVGAGRLQAGSLSHTRPRVNGLGWAALPPLNVLLQIKEKTNFLSTTVFNFEVGRAALPY